MVPGSAIRYGERIRIQVETAYHSTPTKIVVSSYTDEKTTHMRYDLYLSFTLALESHLSNGAQKSRIRHCDKSSACDKYLICNLCHNASYYFKVTTKILIIKLTTRNFQSSLCTGGTNQKT